MATKKELVAELVLLGAVEDEIKDKKNGELEELLLELQTKQGADTGEVEGEESQVPAEANEGTEKKPEVNTEPTNPEPEKENEIPEDGEVVAEFTQQLSIFGQFIYNARNEDVTLIVENLGYGDVYVSEKANVRVGDQAHRLLFKEQRAFKAKKLFMTSASQPVVSVIEIK